MSLDIGYIFWFGYSGRNVRKGGALCQPKSRSSDHRISNVNIAIDIAINRPVQSVEAVCRIVCTVGGGRVQMINCKTCTVGGGRVQDWLYSRWRPCIINN